MKKLYTFGDSFISPYSTNSSVSEWAKLLSRRLNIEYENHGVSGSSSEYAMRQFYNTIVKNNITDSIIIVLLSTPGRLDFEIHDKFPETASIWFHHESAIALGDVEKVNWYKTNKKYIEWYIQNYNSKTSLINRECYIHTLRNFAEYNYNNTIIVLQNSLQSIHHKLLIPKAKDPENFMMPEIDLSIVSKNEIIDFTSYSDFCKYSKWDLRVNHLTIPNLHIMAESVEQMILKKDVSHLSYDKFQKNIIKQLNNKKDLENYVKNGLLFMHNYYWLPN